MAQGVTETETIQDLAVGIIREHPGGIRYTELTHLIHEQDTSLNRNTIRHVVWRLDKACEEIEKPERGLYRAIGSHDSAGEELLRESQSILEHQFYAPFADWLKNEVEDVTKAIALGGSRFGVKWGTPDVIGKRESSPSDIIKQPTEIVSAEIKTNVGDLVTAFGQACAYCLFSHKSYLVVPEKAAPAEVSRLDSLCQVFGLGLMLFDSVNPEDPNFQIRVRPKKQEPDLYFTNKYMKVLESELFG